MIEKLLEKIATFKHPERYTVTLFADMSGFVEYLDYFSDAQDELMFFHDKEQLERTIELLEDVDV